MFDLKRPCVTCPFRVGHGSLFQLGRERLEEIRNAPAFQCHKTLDHSAEEDEEGFSVSRQGDLPEQCAGLMTVLTRISEPNQIMQVAARLGALDPKALDPRDECYHSWEEVLVAHDGCEPPKDLRK